MASARIQKRDGFTLIEVLVVIAIIAIIAAILFPVFASVRERARQATVMDSFAQIQRGLGEFQADYHRYPAALYGYATAGQSMGAPPTTNAAPTGLYPQFIKAPEVFIDPNNPDKDNKGATQSVSVNTLNGSTLATPASTQLFYKADSYDVNPQLTDANTLSSTAYVARYQTSWTDIGAGGVNANRQLRYPNVPGDTFVTLTTYHAPKGVVLALFQSGSAKTIDSRKYLQETGGTDTNYWTITPTGH